MRLICSRKLPRARVYVENSARVENKVKNNADDCLLLGRFAGAGQLVDSPESYAKCAVGTVAGLL